MRAVALGSGRAPLRVGWEYLSGAPRPAPGSDLGAVSRVVDAHATMSLRNPSQPEDHTVNELVPEPARNPE